MDLALRATKVTAQSLGRAMSTLVVQERHLRLCLTDMEQEKVQFLNNPVSQTASSATLSRALPSSSRQHRGRLRWSDTSCIGGNLLLPTRLQPLSLLVAMGASLQLPPLPRCHSSRPTGSVVEPATGRSPSLSRPPANLAVCAGAKGPETGDLENEEMASHPSLSWGRARWRILLLLLLLLFCFVPPAVGLAASDTQNIKKGAVSQGLKRRTTRNHFPPPLSPAGSSGLPKSTHTPLSQLGFQVNRGKSKLVPMQRIYFLDMELDSVSQIARLTQERAQSVLNWLKTLSGRTAVSLKLFQRLWLQPQR